MPATTIKQSQIRDGAINDAKVAAAAAIATTKLADGPNFIKKDGSVAMTGSLNLGNQTITNLATPSSNSDAANKSYVDGQISNLNQIFKVKPNARLATTSSITISNPGTASFDGVTIVSGEILFVRAQSSPAENGLYTFNGSSSALTRISQMDSWAEIPGAFFAVEEGTTYADTLWLCTSNTGGTLGTTAITFVQVPSSAGLQNTNFKDKEIPGGNIDGVNVTYTLANTPIAGSDQVYLNGVLLRQGAGHDYQISGSTITMLTAPVSPDFIQVSYRA